MAKRDYNEAHKGVWIDNDTPFDAVLTVNPYGLVEQSGVYPLSTARDAQRTSGTGSIGDSTNGEYRVRHATGGDEASLATSRHGRYIPGYAAEAGIGVRFAGTLTDASAYAEWGYFHEATDGTVNDGLFFGVDSGGTYIRVVRNSTETHKVYAASWNQAPSHIDATQSDGAVYQIRFSYYGYGLIEWRVVNPSTGDDRQKTTTVHTYSPVDATSLNNSNLQVGARVGSTTGTDDFSAYVGGRKFHILGDFRPQTRTVAHYVSKTSVGTTTIPLMTFRQKTAKKWTPITLHPGTFDSIVSTNNAIIELRVNSDLTGASYGGITNQPAVETSLEVDTTATAVDTTTGVLLWAGLLEGGGGNQSISTTIDQPQIDIPDTGTYSICARAVASTCDIDILARVVEEW